MAGKTRFPSSAGAYQQAALIGFYSEPGYGSPGVGIPTDATTGNVLFVNSVTGTDSAGFGFSPDAPFKTLKYAAETGALANNGDRIYVMPGHVETLATTATITPLAGVTIIGMGVGTNRPKISFTGTAAQIVLSSANIILANVWLDAGIDEVVSAIAISGANVTLDRVDVVEHAAQQFIQFALVTGTDCVIQNCRHHQSTASASNSLWIQGQGCHRLKVLNNWIFITTTNSASSSILETDTSAPVNILIENNIFIQLGGTSTIPINLVTSTTGFVAYNEVASLKTAIAGSIALASCYGAQNYAGHVVNKNGLLEPVVDT
jgi:hypothetical protein